MQYTYKVDSFHCKPFLYFGLFFCPCFYEFCIISIGRCIRHNKIKRHKVLTDINE